MILKSKSHIPVRDSGRESILPVIPVKTVILLPGEVVSVELRQPENLALVKKYAGKSKPVGVVYAAGGDFGGRSADFHQIGTAAKIISSSLGPGGTETVILEGMGRIALRSIRKKKPFLTAKIGYIEEETVASQKTARLFDDIIGIIEQITKPGSAYSEELLALLKLNKDNPGRFADRVAATFSLTIDSKRKILESWKVETRLQALTEILKLELRRVYTLEEFRKYPGWESAQEQLVQELRERVLESDSLPAEVREKSLAEIDRLSHLSTASVEYGATKQYIDWLFEIPWNSLSESSYDLAQIEEEIDRKYYGSQTVKKRILERIAIRKLTGDVSEGPVLCLAGVPGTGKASLAKAIASALGKEFTRFSVGGMSEVSDIKGTARTFLGATPGTIIRTLKEVATANPVVFIEDIDYFSEDSDSALSIALLEAIDPRLNSRFLDKYVGVPIDLSRVFFICAVRSSEDIPEILGHRLEVIEMPGYIEKEKIHIARKYIIPAVLKKYGLLKKDVVFSENGLKKIIRNYTLEAGLINLKYRIQMICRQVAKEKASRVKKVWMVNEKTVESFLGTPKYLPEKPGESPEIGVATGLAWTGQGGDLMLIEGLRMKGSGEVITTGSLGEVMKESIQAAHSYVRSKADILGIDHNDFDNFDIHIHFPSGAIPKDGPSAGVAVSLVIASVMSERPIRNDIAMTGEVTLRGRVLQVAGLIEKISAAYRAGIRKIFVPRENRKDLKNLPPDILKKTKFIFIDSVDDVFARGLLDFVPSSYTLEKIFSKELEKAKNRKKPAPSKKIAAKGSKKK